MSYYPESWLAMNDALATLAIGGELSATTKMPCRSWSIPARLCKTGKRLAKIKGSVCFKCYAGNGNYRYPNVQAALQKRFDAMANAEWEAGMIWKIGKESCGFFRWFDSGDIQSLEHLKAIVRICNATPHIRHWLPTREFMIIRDYVAQGGIWPDNLVVRLSATMLEGEPPTRFASKVGALTSSVQREGASCPAPAQGGKCLECRKCWNKEVANVIYKLH